MSVDCNDGNKLHSELYLCDKSTLQVVQGQRLIYRVHITSSDVKASRRKFQSFDPVVLSGLQLLATQPPGVTIVERQETGATIYPMLDTEERDGHSEEQALEIMQTGLHVKDIPA